MKVSTPDKNSKAPKSPEIEKTLTQRSRFGWMPIVISGAILLNLFLTLRLMGSNRQLAAAQPYVYIQMTDGTVEKARPANNLYRSNETIKNFIRDWLELAYTWEIGNNKLFVRENGTDYPVPFYAASFAVEPGYREAYIATVAKRYRDVFPFRHYISGKNKSFIAIYDEPIIIDLGEGRWRVTVIAHRNHKTSDGMVHEEFNHIFELKAIAPANMRLVGKKDSELRNIMRNMQNQGLQITKIEQF